MRTKTLLLTAALSAAGIVSSMAQAGAVYSVNAVGYVNTTLVPGFNLISNPLTASDNTIAGLFGTQLPDGSLVYKYTGTGYVTAQYDELGGGFIPAAAASTTVTPGEGVFVRIPGTANVTVTFVGEVMQGNLSNPIPAGFSIRSSQVPQEGTAADLGFPAADGDTIYQYESTRATPGYYTSLYDELSGSWSPALKTLKVGEAVFVRKVAPANWTRTFSVNG